MREMHKNSLLLLVWFDLCWTVMDGSVFRRAFPAPGFIEREQSSCYVDDMNTIYGVDVIITDWQNMYQACLKLHGVIFQTIELYIQLVILTVYNTALLFNDIVLFSHWHCVSCWYLLIYLLVYVSYVLTYLLTFLCTYILL